MIESTPLPIDAGMDIALCRGDLYKLAADLLSAPGKYWLSRLADEAGAAALRETAEILDRSSGVQDQPLVPIVARLIEIARKSTLEDLDGARQRLFGHTAHGQVPPYETEYGLDDLFRQSQELADIGGFYNAFGLAVASSAHERQDHIGAECEFMAFLSFREARALSAGDTKTFQVVRDAGRSFLKDHLGRFGRAFARSLRKEAGQPFYRTTADLLFAFLTAESFVFGLPPGPESIRLSWIKEDNAPMACGSVCQLMKGDDPAIGEPYQE
jgi:TorA maturation chaperone TorD